MSSVFFRPKDGYVGDVIPFHHGDHFWLYYLHDRRAGDGTPWSLVRTADFVDYEDAGVALPNGGAADADFNAYTGSVVEADGVHHVFYTGHNPKHLDDATGNPLQVVMHAVSHDDMATWEKVAEDTFEAPAHGYERCDWRDPFVFRPDPAGPWRMLLAARRSTGPDRRRGLIAQCSSWDLRTWDISEPFWDPSLYVTHECPDVFSMGDWWYLVYSEFSERFATRYRVARTPDGPWQVPPADTFDGRAFYAAKTVSDGERRYAVAWIPTKTGERDDGAWEWAGDLAVHQVRQERDGTLSFFLPESVRASFTEAVAPRFETQLGQWEAVGDTVHASVLDSFACTIDPSLPEQYLFSTVIDLAPGTVAAGVVLRASEDGDEGYAIRLEPRAGRMTFDRWPRRRTGTMQWQISGDVPHVAELERPAELRPGRHRLDVLVDGTVFIAYLDDRVAMSGRIYDRPTGGLGLFVREGEATFSETTIKKRPWLDSSARTGTSAQEER